MRWCKAGVLQFQFQGTLQFNRLRDDPMKGCGRNGLLLGKAAPVTVNKQNIRG
jgi:hypothetical protein